MIELGVLRYTPSGVPAIEFKIAHESDQAEAGGTRKVQAEVGAIAFDAQARLISKANLGTAALFRGFLAAKSRRSKRLVLHVTNIEFSEGA